MRLKGTSIIFIIVLVLFLNTVVLADAVGVFNVDNIEKGLLKINAENLNGNFKLMVQKDDSKYYYSINKTEEIVPLQLGSGEYKLFFLENVSGNKYKILEKKQINVDIEDDMSIYLQSAQPVEWSQDMEAIKLAKELTKDINNDKDKIKVIYEYIIENIKYDSEKIQNINDNYIPNIDNTLQEKKGICYDYSSLYGAMLRSLNIPTKLVKGNKNDIDVYHAWNEVYIKEEGKWVTIDTTYDATMKENGTSYDMIKDNKEYEKIREY